jgi:Ser/Thr protein kinase RdoA (MazF antagonist)
MSPPDAVPAAVLARYGAAAAGLTWTRAAGGFSGAAVWRGDDRGAPLLALKAWPSGGMTTDRLARIHGLMRAAGHLPFVPAVLPATDGNTVATEAGRIWDLVRWMPGTADFHANPAPARLANAVTALAQLHRLWAPAASRLAPCPAVGRRLRALAEWTARRPAQLSDGVCRRGAAVVDRFAPAAERALAPWADRPVPVQLCLCDVHHDHVLFTGNNVTGLIDFGAAKEDHVAADLARMLGDMAADDGRSFAAGLTAYTTVNALPEPTTLLVRLLDRTGVVCAVAGWVLRSAAGQLSPPPPAVTARVDRLVRRLEALPPF